MKKLVLVLTILLLAGEVSAAPLMGKGNLVPFKECQCKIRKALFANKVGEVFATVDMTCPMDTEEGKKLVTLRGTLENAAAVGDGRSMKYMGVLQGEPAEIWLTLQDDGSAEAAIAAQGFAWELGTVRLK